MRVPPDLDAAKILAVLKAHGIEYVLIGGFASVYWGSPFLTRDIDITPAQSPANLERLSDALTELDARIRTEDESLPFAHSARSLADSRLLNLTTQHGDLDIAFVPDGTNGYSDL